MRPNDRKEESWHLVVPANFPQTLTRSSLNLYLWHARYDFTINFRLVKAGCGLVDDDQSLNFVKRAVTDILGTVLYNKRMADW